MKPVFEKIIWQQDNLENKLKQIITRALSQGPDQARDQLLTLGAPNLLEKMDMSTVQ